MSGFTYAEPGATRDPDHLPAGYRHVRRRRPIGHGAAAFRAAAEGLATYGVQRLAGLRVRASAVRISVGVDVTVGIGVGPLRLWAPARVVWVDDEPTRYGWAYGTLPGHPERGEEAWTVEIDAAGRVWCDVRAFSRPAAWYARLGGPAARWLQDRVTDRYVAALETWAKGSPTPKARTDVGAGPRRCGPSDWPSPGAPHRSSGAGRTARRETAGTSRRRRRATTPPAGRGSAR